MRDLDALRLSAVAVLAVASLAATCAEAGVSPVVDLLIAEPDTVLPGGSVLFTCVAHDDDGTVVSYTWSATDGSFPSGLTEVTAAPFVPWTAPAAEASYTITCTAEDNDADTSTPEPIAIVVSSVNRAPDIADLTAAKTDLVPGETVVVTCTASDPDADAVTYAWQASAGTITGDGDADPETVTFTAPVGVPRCYVWVEVTDTGGASASRLLWFDVSLYDYSASISSASMRLPVRLAAAPWGEYFVTDRDRVLVFDSDGTLVREITGLARPTSVAVSDAGEVFIGEVGGGGIRAFDYEGGYLWTVAPPGLCLLPADMCLDGEGRLYVTDGRADIVRVFDTAGGQVNSFGGTGVVQGQFRFPTGIAYDLATERLFVADQKNRRIQVFDRDGTWVSSIDSGGSGWDFAYLQGLAVCPYGRVFVADSFQGHVAAMTQAAERLGAVGSFGTGPGQLRLPDDVAIDATGKLVVTSTNNGRIETYQLKDVSGGYGPVPPLPRDPGAPGPATPFAGGCGASSGRRLAGVDAAALTLSAAWFLALLGLLTRKMRRAT